MGGVARTFGGVGGLVVRPKPCQILVFDPGHPFLVLVVVGVLHPFSVGLLLLLLVGQAFVDGLLLLF